MLVYLYNQPLRYIGCRATLYYPGDLGSILGDSGSSTKQNGAHAAYCWLKCNAASMEVLRPQLQNKTIQVKTLESR